MQGRARLWAIVFAVVCLLVAAFLGESYIGRLSNHGGYFLATVEDATIPPRDWRPRHTALIVVDGLRRDFAETMKVTRELERFGQCRISDQGTYTVSRPVYSLLSTGVEVDRSGARNNDLTTPLAAESIWQVARMSGLRVAGSSHLPWWKQLFPNGFDTYDHHEELTEDVFDPRRELADVNVFHPLYVDENGHEHGAASPEYRAAVERADREIAALLARMDLTQDLVVLTADHGHRDAGGHGGAQPEIRNVLECFAGKHVERRVDRARLDGLTTAPALAVLLGLRFPRNMRAGEDALDEIGSIVHEDATSAYYLTDRRAAVERFRQRNRRELERWLGGPPGTWTRLYEREANKQWLRMALAGVLLAGVVIAFVRVRRVPLRRAFECVVFVVWALLVMWGVHHLVLGDFDYSVINMRSRFVPRAFVIASVSAAVVVLTHRIVTRRREGREADFLVLLGVLLAMNVGHVFVYGWPLGFPLPPQPLRYFPFFGAVALATYAAAAVIVVALVSPAGRVRETK